MDENNPLPTGLPGVALVVATGGEWQLFTRAYYGPGKSETSGIHPIQQLAPAALNAGLHADSGRSSLRRQAAGVDPQRSL